MKNSFISKLLAAVALPAFITAAAFTGCSSESSGGGTSGTGGAITSLSVDPASTELESGSSTTLTAKAAVTGDIDVIYSWEITDGKDYATLSATSGASVTLTAKNSDSESHTVKVTVTASYNESKMAKDAYITVKAFKDDTAPSLSSVSINGTQRIESDGEGALEAAVSGENLSGSTITYTWEITYGTDYAEISGDGASATIKGKFANDTEETVKVKVTATLGETSVTSEEYSVVIALRGAEVKDMLTGLSASAGADSVDPGKTVTLTAEPTADGNPTITYTWKISEGEDYADLSATDTATVTLTAKNSDSESHTVKVTVTASDGTNEKTADVSITVNADTTPVFSSVAISGETSIAAAGSTTLTATPTGKNLENASVSYTWSIASGSSYASISGSGASVTLTGKNTTTAEQSVTVKVTAKLGDTSVESSEYTVKVAAKAESGGTDKTGNVSIDVTITDETTYYTVEFVDATEEGYTSNETKTYKVKSGEKVTAPDWERTGYLLTWTSSVDGVTTDSAITANVTFTASWSSSHTVTFKDSDTDGNNDVEVKVANGGTLSESDVPSWEKDHYTLSWTPALDFTTAITADTTYTAVWTEDAKYTVTFKDSDGTNEDDIQTIYSGEEATVPEWTKENYTLSWTSSVEGLSTDSAITADVTFTTVWTELPKCSNCGTHYDTQAEADACSVKEGCPNYGKVTTITFAAQSSKSSAATASSDNDGITVTVSGSMNTKTTISYKNVSYNALKLESSTSITISGAAGKSLTLVMGDASKKIKIGDTTYTGDTSGVVTATAPTGDSFTIKKGDSSTLGVIFIE